MITDCQGFSSFQKSYTVNSPEAYAFSMWSVLTAFIQGFKSRSRQSGTIGPDEFVAFLNGITSYSKWVVNKKTYFIKGKLHAHTNKAQLTLLSTK